MDTVTLVIILLSCGGVAFLVADIFIPTAGILSVVGIGMIATAGIVCFTVSQWLGLGATFAIAVTSPFMLLNLRRSWRRLPTKKNEK